MRKTEQTYNHIKFMMHEIEGLVEDDHELDRGGKTKYGITEKEVLRRGHTYGDIDYSFALDWYFKVYYAEIKLNLIDSEPLRFRMLVDGVHIGRRMPIRHLQLLLNVFNNRQKRWDDIEQDGFIGAQTITALKAYCHDQNINDSSLLVMCDMLRALTFSRYVSIVKNDESQEIWMNGWTRRLSIIPKEFLTHD